MDFHLKIVFLLVWWDVFGLGASPRLAHSSDTAKKSYITFDIHHFATDITYLECSYMQGFPQRENLDLKQGCRLLGENMSWADASS